jgi:hypothetical protein
VGLPHVKPDAAEQVPKARILAKRAARGADSPSDGVISERHSLRFRGTSISRIELAGSRALEFSLRCWLRIPTATTGILAWCWALEGQAPKSILLLHLLPAYAAVLGLVIGDLALLLDPYSLASRPFFCPPVFALAVCVMVSLTYALSRVS